MPSEKIPSLVKVNKDEFASSELGLNTQHSEFHGEKAMTFKI